MRAGVAALVVALLASVGYAALDAVDVVPGVLTSDLGSEDDVPPAPPSESTSQPTSVPPGGSGATADTTTDTTTLEPTRGGLAGLRTPAAQSGQDRAGRASGGPLALPSGPGAAPGPTRKGLERALATALADPALGPSVGLQVRDAAGTVVYSRDDRRAKTPASTTKVLTAVAVAQAQDLTQRFLTRALYDPGADAGAGSVPTIVLVAGGDNLLAADAGDPGAVAGQAGLGDLARAVAAALPTPRPKAVRLVLDDRFARGPAVAPGWGSDDVRLGLTGPVAMLGLATDRAVPYRPASADPAMTATAAFAKALAAAGVPVTGRPARGHGTAAARAIAEVRSAPVGDVLALALDESDNDLTESVARWACARDRAPTTFAGCAGWVRSRLADAGLDVSAVRLADTSGLSTGTSVPVSVVGQAMWLGTSGRNPGLAAVLSRLPVAGLSGTLHDRFRAPEARAGVGVVRAKTGTLTGVGALAGSVVDAEGEALTFAVIADRVPPAGTAAARAALDRLAATLAGCGCR